MTPVVCSKAMLEDRLLVSNTSVLVIHDWERQYYKPMVTRYKYIIYRKALLC